MAERMRRLSPAAVTLVCLCGLLCVPRGQVRSQERTPPAPPPLVITQVTVIDPESGSVQRDRAVIVRDGRISRIEPAGTPVGEDLRTVDGRGKFLIPGLWDMHTHLSWTAGSALPVLVANGITSVRDLGGDLGEIDTWRTLIGAGTLAGPRIWRAGPILNGQSFNKYQLVAADPGQARGIVRALKQVGVDFIKIHRRTPREAYFAIVDQAKKEGLRVVGHIPMTVRPEEASDAGQLVEHTETLFEGTFAASLEGRPLAEAIQGFRAGSAVELFARFARNRTSVTPALIVWRYQIDRPDYASFQADPRSRYVARSLKEAARKMEAPSEEGLAAMRRTYDEYSAVVAQMHLAGVMLLAGSDIAGPRIPGFTLHEELAALVAAGLNPLEALRAATWNPARVLGVESDFGGLTPGRIADLVLLDADPLQDIRNTQRIAAVVVGGKLLARADLDALLETGAEMAARH